MIFSSISCGHFRLEQRLPSQGYTSQAKRTTLARFNFSTDSACPASITLLDELVDDTFLADLSGNLEASRERVHSANMSVEQVDRFKAFASYLRIKIDPTLESPPCLRLPTYTGLSNRCPLGIGRYPNQAKGHPCSHRSIRVPLDDLHSPIRASSNGLRELRGWFQGLA